MHILPAALKIEIIQIVFGPLVVIAHPNTNYASQTIKC
jgi:hypothetical protein